MNSVKLKINTRMSSNNHYGLVLHDDTDACDNILLLKRDLASMEAIYWARAEGCKRGKLLIAERVLSGLNYL